MKTRCMFGLLAIMALISVSAAAATKLAKPAPEDPVPALVPGDDRANYDLCLSTARSYPEQGFELAGRWEGIGGGEPAKHCTAVALIGLHEYAEGASRLEDLAASSRDDADVKAGMLAQAGQAWYLGGDDDHAYADQTEALKIAPPKTKQAEAILVDRAATLADAGKYDEAVTDLTAALAIEPANVEALTFRANAYRDLNKLDLAAADVEHAVAINPADPEARLMRGIIYRLKGRNADARQDWFQVLKLAPNSDAARAAKADIERLDIRIEKIGDVPQTPATATPIPTHP